MEARSGVVTTTLSFASTEPVSSKSDRRRSNGARHLCRFIAGFTQARQVQFQAPLGEARRSGINAARRRPFLSCRRFPLSPSEGERAGVRGISTAPGGTDDMRPAPLNE